VRDQQRFRLVDDLHGKALFGHQQLRLVSDKDDPAEIRGCEPVVRHDRETENVARVIPEDPSDQEAKTKARFCLKSSILLPLPR